MIWGLNSSYFLSLGSSDIVIGRLQTNFSIWTFLHLVKTYICIFKSKRVSFKRYKRKIISETNFWDFDHWRFQMDKLWHHSTRISVVKTASKLLFIKVLTSNHWCVEFSGWSNNRLSLNQLIELRWSVEFMILGTISFICKVLLIQISRRGNSRFQKIKII